MGIILEDKGYLRITLNHDTAFVQKSQIMLISDNPNGGSIMVLAGGYVIEPQDIIDHLIDRIQLGDDGKDYRTTMR